GVTVPSAGGTVSGTSVTLAAETSDPSGISTVQFLVDGSPVGSPLLAPPYTSSWDSTTVPNGDHTITAQATNGLGVVSTSAPVQVTVSKAESPGQKVDAKVSIEGNGAVTTPAFSTSQAGDVLVAFSSSDGSTKPQTLSVSGAGLTWTLVGRAN